MAERYAPKIKRLLLLTPADGKETHIDRGSAIVAEDIEGPGLTVYYEGGRFTSMDWAEKITHAAGRLVERYPTAARAHFSRTELSVVGLVEWDEHVHVWAVTEVREPALLRAWRGGEETPLGPTESQRQTEAGRLLSSGGTKAMMAWARAKQLGEDPIGAILSTRED